jgi:transcriptional regulator with GAF, ATPase, and Fis domain
MSEGPTRQHQRPTTARYDKVRVSVSAGPDTGLAVEVAGTPVRVGTSPESDLVLTDDSVSRHHCELLPVGRGMRVRDPGSTNGVYFGTARLRDAEISGDVELTVGDSRITVHWLGETVDRDQALGDRFGDVLGKSAPMRELFAQLERIAPTDYSLLIDGETGTGKDVIAESVHSCSPRAQGPFVVLDCGAVSPNVIESELFGHERGAFTGAVEARAGVFEQADGGTLFIDEIGELPLALQPKLLRVLEKHELRRVGGSRTLKVNVRVLAATNRNLKAEAQRGNFRQDLFYRLAAAHVHVPPLRDRPDDVGLLVAHFVKLEHPSMSVNDVPPTVWELFRNYHWPGNVRELRNAVVRLAISPELPLTAQHQRPADLTAPASDELQPLQVARREASDRFERDYLSRVLALADGNVTKAAELASVSRQMMQKLMRKHDARGT